jgi:type I restriction enzyme S subunit
MSEKLPKGWVETELSSILKLKNGFAFKSTDYKEEGIPVIRISDIQDGLITSEKAVCVNEFDRADDFIVEKGDILIAMSGATTGKFGVFNDDYKAYQNQRVGNLKPIDSNINKKFIYYLIGNLKKEIEEKAYGGAQPNISAKLIEEIKINLPPLNEQQRIVAKLDQIFSHLETAKKGLEKIPVLLKQFRQSVLTQAVTGKLTEEWREGKETSSSELMSSLQKHHFLAGGHKKGNASHPDLEKHNLTFNSIPLGWGLLELRELCHREKPITYGILMPGPEIKDGRPYLKVMSYPNNVLDFEKVRHTTVEIEESFKRSRLTTGDIVLSIRGTVGRVIIIPEELNGANITQDSARISVQEKMNNVFIALCMKSQEVQKLMETITKGVAVRGINIGDIRYIKLPIPSYTEQTEIVRRVETLFAKADAIEVRYKVLKEKIDNLPQAVLAKAFRGEL